MAQATIASNDWRTKFPEGTWFTVDLGAWGAFDFQIVHYDDVGGIFGAHVAVRHHDGRSSQQLANHFGVWDGAWVDKTTLEVLFDKGQPKASSTN